MGADKSSMGIILTIKSRMFTRIKRRRPKKKTGNASPHPPLSPAGRGKR